MRLKGRQRSLKEKDCCKDQNNHEIYWQLNIFEDWEPVFTYCKVCKEVIEEHVINRG